MEEIKTPLKNHKTHIPSLALKTLLFPKELLFSSYNTNQIIHTVTGLASSLV
jgi:hypothetical protein